MNQPTFLNMRVTCQKNKINVDLTEVAKEVVDQDKLVEMEPEANQEVPMEMTTGDKEESTMMNKTNSEETTAEDKTEMKRLMKSKKRRNQRKSLLKCSRRKKNGLKFEINHFH